MDVRCTRCGTEYEFDDALISERGTSVRCTQCGFQFKIFPPKLASVGPDEWVVLTSLGRKVVYRSLRELQNGISKSEVAREDLLARGSKPPRPLGSIAELEPLFTTKAGPERQPSTLTGVAPPPPGADKVVPATSAAGRKVHDTFSGVAPPPPAGIGDQSLPPPGGSLGREGHDTFSGVAPPANSPDGGDAHAGPPGVRPAPPMRVGGTRTVLGIGSAPTAKLLEPAEPPKTTAIASQTNSNPPETRSFESTRLEEPEQLDPSILLSDPPTRPLSPTKVEVAQLPKRQEVTAPLPRVETELGVAPPPRVETELGVAPPRVPTSSHAAEPAIDHAGEAPDRNGNQVEHKALAKVQLATKAVIVPKGAADGASDPPTVRWTGPIVEENHSNLDQRREPVEERPKPPSPRRSETKTTDDDGGVQTTKPSAPALVPASPALPVTTSSSPKTARSNEMVAPIPGAAEERVDSVTAEGPSQGPASRRDADASAKVEAKVVTGDTSAKALEPATVGAGNETGDKVPSAASGAAASARKHSAVDASSQSRERRRESSQGASTIPVSRGPSKARQATAPPAASNRDKNSSALSSGSIPPKPFWTTGRILTAVGLLACGVFAGMKIAGTQLGRKAGPSPMATQPVAAVPSVVSAKAAQQASQSETWLASVDDQLRAGNHAAAERLLGEVPASEREALAYRQAHLRSQALSAEMVWWKVQLIGKNAGDAYTHSKRQLNERLEGLKREFSSLGPESTWTEPVFAASLDARRMQGEKQDPSAAAVAERLKNPQTSELKYTQLILSWVHAGQPDEATIDGLTRLQATPADLGPRPVALIVALVQLNRVEDAKKELARIVARTPAHPLLAEMQAYVSKAEQPANSESQVDAGGPESTAADHDLIEGDFRLRLTRASECLSRNELTRAQKLLRSVLAERPNDTEAITAMADVHRRRGDSNQAKSLYDKALALNGNYLPAMSGAADLRWRAGERASAAVLYRRIIERVGESAGYGQVAAARLKEMEAPPPSTPKDAP